MNKRYEVGSKEFTDILNNFINQKSITNEGLLKLMEEDCDQVFFQFDEVAIYKDKATLNDPPLISIKLKNLHPAYSLDYVYSRKSKGTYALKAITVWWEGDAKYDMNFVLLNISRAEQVLYYLDKGEKFKILGADVPEDAIGFGLKDKSDFNNYDFIAETISIYLMENGEWRRHLLEDIKNINLADWELDAYFESVKAKAAERACLFIVGKDPTREDALDWMLKLMTEAKLAYHPDDPAEQYVNRDTKKQALTDEECELLDTSNRNLFKKFGKEIYKIGVEAQHKYEELRKK